MNSFPADHLEGYAPAPRKGDPILEARAWPPTTPLTPEEFYERAVGNGQYAVDNDPRDREGLQDFHPNSKRVGLPGGSADGRFAYDYTLHDIEEEDRRAWSSKYSCAPFVQLIIGREGSKDAREMLEGFDLTICTTRFDGGAFFIPSPHDTFRAKTTCVASRRAVIEAFMNSGCREILVFINAVEKCASMSPRNRFDCLHRTRLWFLRALRQMPAEVWAAVGFGGPQICERRCLRFVYKLAHRMQIYSKRGVGIIDPPAGWKTLRYYLRETSDAW